VSLLEMAVLLLGARAPRILTGMRDLKGISRMRKIIITDLTRFQNPEIVCTAGTDTKSGACLRPMPYLRTEECERLKILPGAILSGEFIPQKGLSGPHQEDARYSKLTFEGPSSSEEFRGALEAGLHDSVEDGFDIKLKSGQKYVPVGHSVARSIITLSVDPHSIQIIEDRYNPGKTKIHFVDSSGSKFRYLSITDLGFHRYADSHRAAKDLVRLNAFIKNQREAYIRLGLSRAWNNGTVNGYWMQANGVYTFPEFFEGIRSHK